MVLGKPDIPNDFKWSISRVSSDYSILCIRRRLGFRSNRFCSRYFSIFSVQFFEKRKIDYSIFALSVHGVAGVWGTLSTGFFATPELAFTGSPGLFYGGGFDQLLVQLYGVVACGSFAFIVSFIILYVMKLVMGGLRVTEEEEIMGLDLSEHGSYGYPEQMKLEEAKIN